MSAKLVRAAVVAAALAGCARTPDPAPEPPDPTGERRLKETRRIADLDPPGKISTADAIALYPVLLVADTAIKISIGTYRFLRNLAGGAPENPLPLPERLKREAEKIPER